MGEIAALLGAMIWAGTSVALTSLSSRTNPVVLSGLRLMAGSLVIPLILLASGEAHDLADAPTWRLLGISLSGMVGYGIGDTLYIRTLHLLGMQRAFPISMALFITLTVAGGVVLLGEPAGFGLPAGALLIGAGVYLIVVPGQQRAAQPYPVPPVESALSGFAELPGDAPEDAPHPMLGYALLLLVGIAWATATLWLAQSKGDVGAVAAGSIRAPAGAIALLAFAALTRPADIAAPFRARGHIGLIIAAGVAGTAIGSLLYVYAVGEAGAARTALLNATAPLMGLPLSIFFLKERFTQRVGLGTLLCVAGIAFVVA